MYENLKIGQKLYEVYFRNDDVFGSFVINEFTIEGFKTYKQSSSRPSYVIVRNEKGKLRKLHGSCEQMTEDNVLKFLKTYIRSERIKIKEKIKNLDKMIEKAEKTFKNMEF